MKRATNSIPIHDPQLLEAIRVPALVTVDEYDLVLPEETGTICSAICHYDDKRARASTAYDNIFVCGPCWWRTFPCALLGQLEKLDWTGKNVFALMTHEGSESTVAAWGGAARELQDPLK